MEYVKLGSTGLEVSKICLGAMSFGDVSANWMHTWVLDAVESDAIIKKSLELGINFYDTANVYSLGTSEVFLGHSLKKYAKRNEYIIATKVGSEMRSTPNGSGLSRKAIFEEVEASLERLELDYIDILYIHRWDYSTPIEETMCALNDLVKSGKVLYLGASSMFAWQFSKAQYTAKINGWTPFSVMQNHYNLLYREEEREMIPMCRDMGVALVPYSPLAAGRLTRNWESSSKRFTEDKIAHHKYDNTQESDKEIVKRVQEVASRHKVTPAQVALSWLWRKGATAPIVGVTKLSYLDDFVAAFDLKLSNEEIDYLDEKYSSHPIMGHK